MKTFKSYGEAVKSLPLGAVLNTTFGNIGEGGYAEIHHADDGRYSVTNGSWMTVKPFTWTVRKLEG